MNDNDGQILLHEPWVLCSHKIPVHFGCNFCHVEKRIDKDIQNIIKLQSSTDKEVFDLEKRIEKLESHLNYQIDENRKVSRRIDEIEEIITSNSLIAKDIIFEISKIKDLVSNLSQKNSVSDLSQEKQTCVACQGFEENFIYKCEICDGKRYV